MKVFRIRSLGIAVTAVFILYTGHEVFSQKDDVLSRIKEIEANIEKTKKELEKDEKKLQKLKSDEQKTLAELDQSYKEIETIDKNLRTIKQAEKSLNSEITVAQNRYDSAQKILAGKSDMYAERLRSIYKRQKVSPVGMLFTSGSISSSLRGLKMLTMLTAADLQVVDELREESETLNSTLNRLTKSLNAKITLARRREREQISLKNSTEKKNKVLGEIRQDEELLEELIRQHNEDLKSFYAFSNKFIRDRKKEGIPVRILLEGYNFAGYKGKLPWPVNGKVVSQFGRVVDSRTKTETYNRGVEIETNRNEPVKTVGSGEVVMTQFFRGYGNFVMIFHPPDYYSIYGHLSDFLVNIGDIVMEGDIIGLAGNTGIIDGGSPRLVLEILKEEKPENPLSWLSRDSQRAGT